MGLVFCCLQCFCVSVAYAADITDTTYGGALQLLFIHNYMSHKQTQTSRMHACSSMMDKVAAFGCKHVVINITFYNTDIKLYDTNTVYAHLHFFLLYCIYLHTAETK